MANRNRSVRQGATSADRLHLAAGASTSRVEHGSGNVFADLELADADELDTKVGLAVAVNRALKARRLTQTAAAELLAINQRKVSVLKRYELEGPSIERQTNS